VTASEADARKPFQILIMQIENLTGVLLKSKRMFVGKSHEVRKNVGRLSGEILRKALEYPDSFCEFTQFFEKT